LRCFISSNENRLASVASASPDRGAHNTVIGVAKHHRKSLWEVLYLTVSTIDDAAPDRYMDPTLIRELVRRRLKDGRLPQGRVVCIREIGRFSSAGRQCDACDERIGPNQKAVLLMVSLQWMSVFFHDDCYKVWDAERLGPL